MATVSAADETAVFRVLLLAMVSAEEKMAVETKIAIDSAVTTVVVATADAAEVTEQTAQRAAVIQMARTLEMTAQSLPLPQAVAQCER